MCKTNIQQNFIAWTIKKNNKDVTKKCTQTNVEHIESNVWFYFYSYPLGI
jgi:hypothetical protein